MSTAFPVTRGDRAVAEQRDGFDDCQLAELFEQLHYLHDVSLTL
ncbi:hypothetical protein [Microlunatus elymi]|nr:hypothetical protein [Microlunatus elymi]